MRCRSEDRVSPGQEPAISSSQSPKTVHVYLAIPARASMLSNKMASGTSASSTTRNICEQGKSYDAPTAPGPSCMRFEHLKPCLDSRELCDLVCGMVQSVVPENPTIEIGQALAVSHLIGLAKENGDVRPIAVGECLGVSVLVILVYRRKLPWQPF